ncbi:unnamed protein product, partial [Orchesella dallaii]
LTPMLEPQQSTSMALEDISKGLALEQARRDLGWSNATVKKLEEELRAQDTIIASMQKDPMVLSLKAKDLEIGRLQEQLQDREAEIELVNMKILYNKYLHNKNGGRCLLKLGHARSRIIALEDNGAWNHTPKNTSSKVRLKLLKKMFWNSTDEMMQIAALANKVFKRRSGTKVINQISDSERVIKKARRKRHNHSRSPKLDTNRKMDHKFPDATSNPQPYREQPQKPETINREFEVEQPQPPVTINDESNCEEPKSKNIEQSKEKVQPQLKTRNYLLCHCSYCDEDFVPDYDDYNDYEIFPSTDLYNETQPPINGADKLQSHLQFHIDTPATPTFSEDEDRNENYVVVQPSSATVTILETSREPDPTRHRVIVSDDNELVWPSAPYGNGKVGWFRKFLKTEIVEIACVK